MIDCFPFAGYPVAVLGLGDEGRAAARALHRSEAEVSAWDADGDLRDDAAEDAIPVADLSAADWRDFVSLVIERAIPHGDHPHPLVRAALDAGSEVISDAELLVRSQRLAEFVGVTGADGAAFASHLIHYVLTLSGKEAEVAGVPGLPIMNLHALDGGGTYVLFMPPDKLDITVSITFDTACWIGAPPPVGSSDRSDLLERQGLIFHRQTSPRTAVVYIDDADSRDLRDRLTAVGDQVVVPVSGEGAVAGGVYVDAGVLCDDSKGGRVAVLPFDGLAVYDHERDRTLAAVAYAAALSRGVEAPAAMASIRSFPGVAGMRAPLKRVDGILYVDDSTSQTLEETHRSLAGYDGAVVWIGGGGPLETVTDKQQWLADAAAAAVIVGDTVPGSADRPTHRARDLGEAVDKAHALACDLGARVVYSPGTSAAGADFADAVAALPGAHEDADEID